MGYFPPLAQNIRGKIRQAVKASKDEAEVHQRVAELSEDLDELTPFSSILLEHEVIIQQSGYKIHFPRRIPPVVFVLIAYDYVEWLKRKYSFPGFCEVEESDVVFDCGAYVGGFSMAVANKSEATFCFEPAPANYRCLAENASQFPNIHPYAIGLGTVSESLPLNLSRSSVEHSFLDTDRGGVFEVVDIEVRTVQDFVADTGIDRIDFFKIEAEGFEIEVFQGLGDLPPKKIAIDVSPERNQESPSAYFQEELAARGYEVRIRRNVLFGVLK